MHRRAGRQDVREFEATHRGANEYEFAADVDNTLGHIAQRRGRDNRDVLRVDGAFEVEALQSGAARELHGVAEGDESHDPISGADCSQGDGLSAAHVEFSDCGTEHERPVTSDDDDATANGQRLYGAARGNAVHTGRAVGGDEQRVVVDEGCSARPRRSERTHARAVEVDGLADGDDDGVAVDGEQTACAARALLQDTVIIEFRDDAGAAANDEAAVAGDHVDDTTGDGDGAGADQQR